MINHNCDSIYHICQAWQGIEDKDFLIKATMCQTNLLKTCGLLTGFSPNTTIFTTSLVMCFSLGTKLSSALTYSF